MGAHMFLTLCFLLSFQVIALILNLPLVAWNVNKCVPPSRPPLRGPAADLAPSLIRRVTNKNHMYDATEIFRTLGQHKKECFFKLGFYLLCFFYYLYRRVLVRSDPYRPLPDLKEWYTE